ncbi:uncharacterized protein GGS25DRAFT_465899 [Hypoxylon fragiforme]|uniref:uncharacterized protein n=1 Tax=Hypoxylon fragiforme TaxID=63214 RepID=UPI0020C6F4CB|nr:uncharacterized protein GGS25DRAFT_465899 [Hypoxylon fragiforme]KAI2604556.1 hypothetical protein GGS25DRAFT_465899 [Hypoxylon fragiforme]
MLAFLLVLSCLSYLSSKLAELQSSKGETFVIETGYPKGGCFYLLHVVAYVSYFLHTFTTSTYPLPYFLLPFRTREPRIQFPPFVRS